MDQTVATGHGSARPSQADAFPPWLESRGPEADRAWVAATAAGDEAAFEALFHAYHAPLCAFFYRYVGTRDLAEEIVQEVFLFVWERRQTWEVRTSVKNYLFTATENTAHLRRNRRAARDLAQDGGSADGAGAQVAQESTRRTLALVRTARLTHRPAASA